MGAPGVAAGWIMSRDMYEPQFRAYIDRVLGDLAGGNARTLDRWNAALDSLASPAR
jgi:hypothetical protein